MDEANAEGESFDPSVDFRDYDQVARALPVFCVSSKAYQKLKGRLRRDHAVKAFCNTEETEIPALQAHCLSLTVAQRKSGCQSFLNGLQQLVNSLDLLCSISGSSESLCEERKENNRVFLQSRLDALQLVCSKSRSIDVYVSSPLSAHSYPGPGESNWRTFG